MNGIITVDGEKNTSGHLGNTTVNPDGSFICNLCRPYNLYKDVPVLGFFIKILHYFIHVLQARYNFTC